MRRGAGTARVLVVGALGAGAVAAATVVPAGRPGVVAGAPVAAAPALVAEATAVTRRVLVCSGDAVAGLALPGAAPAPAAVAATVAPPGLAGVPGERPGGTLVLDGLPTGGRLDGAATGAGLVGARIDGARSVRVTGALDQAPTLAAAQRTVVTTGEGRTLAAAPCVEPTLDAYLVGGAGSPGAQEHVVLTNPNPTPVVVQLAVLGTHGTPRSATSGAIALPAGARRTVLLDGLAPGEAAPVVHVAATGGPVAATMRTSWIDGIVPRGGDDIVPTTPARRTVAAVGALPAAGSLRVRVAAPERAATADVVVHRDGGPDQRRSLAVAASSSTDWALALPAGATSVEVTADAPVVVGASLEARGPGGTTDLAWSGATAALTAPVGLPLAVDATAGLVHTLTLTGEGDVVVTTVGADGTATASRQSLRAGRPERVDVSRAASVWVSPQRAREVRATVTTTLDHAGTPLVSVQPLPARTLVARPTTVVPR